MNERSELFSMLCGDEMSKGDVVRHHLIMFLVLVAVVAAEDAIWLSLMCAVTVAWMVLRK